MRQDLSITIKEAPLVTKFSDSLSVHAIETPYAELHANASIEFPKASVPTLIERLAQAAGIAAPVVSVQGLTTAMSHVAVGRWLAAMQTRAYELADKRNKELDEANAN